MQFFNSLLSLASEFLQLVSIAFVFVCLLGRTITQNLAELALVVAAIVGFGFEMALFAAFLSTRLNFDSRVGKGVCLGVALGAICSIALLRQQSVVDSLESMIGLAIIFLGIFAIVKVIFNRLHRNDPLAYCWRPDIR